MGSIPQYARLFGEFCHKPLTPKKNRAPVSQGAVHDIGAVVQRTLTVTDRLWRQVKVLLCAT
jgi:hypothetical protein